ncbi:HTH-type transcriptional regulator PuuR [uncultured Roseburia sp.]|uniref:Helix-turn-helix transcriptional regulator n=1 Tax=Brotonthovivens ammoniilytica TaxID=2981725 RepID=A0ABT2TI85_9FIRM|nr:helix-turn-helix transcriptional regulator [Brotonthovivens ammoniilytica]MCU6761817.1 helix-turn-helix transcriptional regulator [Brotonthovivens ammoniilytica]SCI47592.1 HTH-type transcriptional regulator PuuR [uncultured Roseburia sp.]
MDVIARINEIMKKQGLTPYQFAKLSGLSQSTISNMSTRNTIPSVPTIESICEYLNISLAQFFADEGTDFYPVDDRQREVLDIFILLDTQQQEAILSLLRSMKPDIK